MTCDDISSVQISLRYQKWRKKWTLKFRRTGISLDYHVWNRAGGSFWIPEFHHLSLNSLKANWQTMLENTHVMSIWCMSKTWSCFSHNPVRTYHYFHLTYWHGLGKRSIFAFLKFWILLWSRWSLDSTAQWIFTHFSYDQEIWELYVVCM